jgi:hypothetical protein
MKTSRNSRRSRSNLVRRSYEPDRVRCGIIGLSHRRRPHRASAHARPIPCLQQPAHVCPQRAVGAAELHSPWELFIRSQIDSPFPSAFHAPSIWYDAVAVPHRNPSGKRRIDALFSLDCAAAPPALVVHDPSAADPVTLARSHRVSSAAIDVPRSAGVGRLAFTLPSSGWPGKRSRSGRRSL